MTRASWYLLGLFGAVITTAYLAGLFENPFFLYFFLPLPLIIFVVCPDFFRIQLFVVLSSGLVLLGRLHSPTEPKLLSFRHEFVDVAPKEWRFAFQLDQLSQYRERCREGVSALLIDGRKLAALEVLVNDEHRLGTIAPLGWLERMRVPLKETSGVLEVRLRRVTTRNGDAPGIYQGPELHAGIIFSDAVFVEREGPTCRLALHARRGCPEACYDAHEDLIPLPPERVGN